jgi:dynein heavy chain, axonemal
MLMITPGNCQSKEALLRLWVHESCRVFHDRLINLEDKTYFKHMLAELITKHGLGTESYDDIFVKRNVIFGDFLRPGVDRQERVYEEVQQGRVPTLYCFGGDSMMGDDDGGQPSSCAVAASLIAASDAMLLL